MPEPKGHNESDENKKLKKILLLICSQKRTSIIEFHMEISRNKSIFFSAVDPWMLANDIVTNVFNGEVYNYIN